MLSRVIWLLLGRITGCLMTSGRSACTKHPRTRNTPCLSINGSSFDRLLFNFKFISSWELSCPRALISSGKVSACADLMMINPASSISLVLTSLSLLAFFLTWSLRISINLVHWAITLKFNSVPVWVSFDSFSDGRHSWRLPGGSHGTR